MVNPIYNFIATHTILVAILLIGGFFLVRFLTRKKTIQNKNTQEKEVQEIKKEIVNVKDNSSIIVESEKDTTPKRIARGFRTMVKKIQESDYIKGMQEEQETAKFDDMLPKELIQNINPQESNTKNKKKNNHEEEQEDEFSMDFSKMTKVDF